MTTSSASRRVLAVLERNVRGTRFGPSSWVLVLAGLIEPLFYLLTIGVGLGTLIGRHISYDGQSVPYAEFVAPGTLAASAVTGALGVSVYSFHNRFKYARLYEVMLSTPILSREIAVGELTWAIVRGGLFSALFLAVMSALGLIRPERAPLALAAAVLVCAAFAAGGMAITTYIRSWQDFDLIALAQTGMILFSGTFFPVSLYPSPLKDVVYALPLYHAVELVRTAALGQASGALAGHTGYLLLMFIAGLYVTCRQMDRHLRE